MADHQEPQMHADLTLPVAADSDEQLRPFEFGEFFSGMNFTITVEAICRDRVHVATAFHEYDGWDVLTDAGFELGLKVCQQLDHGHFAPPLTEARRSDEFGLLRELRSVAAPGLGASRSRRS